MARFLASRSVLLYPRNCLSQFPYLKYDFKWLYRRETPHMRIDSWYFATKAFNFLFKGLVPRLLPSRSVLLNSKNSLSQFSYAKYNFKWFYRRGTPPNRVYSWYFENKPVNRLLKSLVPRLLKSRSVLVHLDNSLSYLRSPNRNFQWFYRREKPLNRVDSLYFATKALNFFF